MTTVIWTIITCLFLAAHIYFAERKESTLAILLKYNLFGILYLASFGCLRHFVPSNGDIGKIFCFMIVAGSMMVFCVAKFCSICFEDGTLLDYEFIKRYFIVNEDGSRISYKLFEQMYLLYPEKFHFSDYGWCYRTEDFSLSFFDYIRARHMIESNACEAERIKYRAKRFQDSQKLIAVMQQDLEKAMLAAQKEKEQAFQEVESATKDAHELFKGLSKYN